MIVKVVPWKTYLSKAENRLNQDLKNLHSPFMKMREIFLRNSSLLFLKQLIFSAHGCCYPSNFGAWSMCNIAISCIAIVCPFSYSATPNSVLQPNKLYPSSFALHHRWGHICPFYFPCLAHAYCNLCACMHYTMHAVISSAPRYQ